MRPLKMLQPCNCTVSTTVCVPQWIFFFFFFFFVRPGGKCSPSLQAEPQGPHNPCPHITRIWKVKQAHTPVETNVLSRSTVRALGAPQTGTGGTPRGSREPGQAQKESPVSKTQLRARGESKFPRQTVQGGLLWAHGPELPALKGTQLLEEQHAIGGRHAGVPSVNQGFTSRQLSRSTVRALGAPQTGTGGTPRGSTVATGSEGANGAQALVRPSRNRGAAGCLAGTHQGQQKGTRLGGWRPEASQACWRADPVSVRRGAEPAAEEEKGWQVWDWGGNQENSRGRGLMGSGKGERSAGKGGLA